MKKFAAALLLLLVAACQSAPRLEDDTRYVKLAKVVEEHEFTDIERQQAKANLPADSGVGVGLSIGVGSGGGFGGIMLGAGSRLGERRHQMPPQIAFGANRFTVQTADNARIEVMSYEKYKVGDCVKVLVNHPTEFPRFFKLKPGEHCD